jgi:hypothetical protein
VAAVLAAEADLHVAQPQCHRAGCFTLNLLVGCMLEVNGAGVANSQGETG